MKKFFVLLFIFSSSNLFCNEKNVLTYYKEYYHLKEKKILKDNIPNYYYEIYKRNKKFFTTNCIDYEISVIN